jgi:uncharacterized protein (TIGR02271 family)
VEVEMQQTTLSIEQLKQMTGCPVYDTGGEKIGDMDRIYYDFETRVPEWIGISSGFLGMKQVVAPLQGATEYEDGLRVQFSRDQVKDSPAVDGDEIEENEEQELYSHYGIGFSGERSGSQLPEGASPTGGQTGDTMTLHEEQLKVGKRPVDAGSVRIRKYVETTPVSEELTLEQETAEIERRPVNRPAAEGELGEQEIEVNLRGEEPVVEKQVTAREEIGVRKGTQQRTETVGGEVRREQADVEGADYEDEVESHEREDHR